MADGYRRFPAPSVIATCLVPAVLLNPAPDGAVNTAAYIGATGE